jgi:antagonist of KipI
MSLRVLDPGLCSLVVDFGRPSYRSLGVPIGGAADRTALALGNALVGNPPDAAGLEIALAGPRLRAECALACVVYGAPFALASDRQRLTVGKSFTLAPDEVLRVGGAASGARAYLCVAGGLEAPVVLGSRSALRPLEAGDILPCRPGSIHGRWVHADFSWRKAREALAGPEAPGQRALLVLEGAQADWFPADALVSRKSAPPPRFTVSPASDRMGLRLRGPPLPVPDRELLSEPVCPGTVQVTRDGQRIILGVDSQTIGGYPKVGQVISADLDELGQLRPGDRIRFVRVRLEDAEGLYRQKHADLHEWTTRLRVSLGGLGSRGLCHAGV